MAQNRDKLKSLRTDRKLRQIDVALAIGMKACYYGMIERGERNPILDDAKKIADFFGTTVDELFFAS